ncbi:hypothetical protein JVU11DRAFT_3081 [Chiua virens]|nr:hypothetical protein JVU11DRAFT_3081 [Chiua virens]
MSHHGTCDNEKPTCLRSDILLGRVHFCLSLLIALPECRASAVSVVTSGFLLGILIARVLSGVVSNLVNWYYVYWMSAGTQSLAFIGSYLVFPDYPAVNRGLSYLNMFHYMAKFMAKEPLVVQIVLIIIAGSACYTDFWATPTFLLCGLHITILREFFCFQNRSDMR